MNVQIDGGQRTSRTDNTRTTEPQMREQLEAGNRVFFRLTRGERGADTGVWFEAIRRDDGTIRYAALTEPPTLG